MKYLRIINQGEIEVQALSLLGASTKRGDSSKIGMFGSGNKYAIAYFLRNGSIDIYSGMKKIPVEVRKEIFREKEFGVVHIGGEKTSITTEFGMDWKFWQAVREIYSNALDEGNAKIALVEKITPKADETHFYIKADETDAQIFIDEFDLYFSEKKKVLATSSIGQILEKNNSQGMCVYRKGIRCYDNPKKSIFDYNFNELRIGENRLCQYYWDVTEKIWGMLFQLEDEMLIERLLRNCHDGDYFEGDVDSIASLPHVLSEQFKTVLSRLKLAPRSFYTLVPKEEVYSYVWIPYVWIPDKIYNHLIEYIDEDTKPKGLQTSKDGQMFKEFTPDRLQSMTLKSAMDFFKEAEFGIPYDIKTAMFEKKKILGIAHTETMSIILSDICLTRGVNDVVNTIIEEYIHLKYDVRDETRAFQEASITEFINYMKRRNTYVL